MRAWWKVATASRLPAIECYDLRLLDIEYGTVSVYLFLAYICELYSRSNRPMVDTAEDRSTIGHIHCQHSCELKPQESGEQEMEQEMAVFSET